MPDDISLLQRWNILPDACWWVCQMHGGGYFMAAGKNKPEGRLLSTGASIAADSYRVLYGPCTEREAEDYLADVES